MPLGRPETGTKKIGSLIAVCIPLELRSSVRTYVEEPLIRSEEHTSELQSQSNLVCRLLLEKKKKLIFLRLHKASQEAITYQHTILNPILSRHPAARIDNMLADIIPFASPSVDLLRSYLPTL